MSETTGEASGAPQAHLMQLITGFMPARIVHLAAQLGLADQLAEALSKRPWVDLGRID
jgi:hypothetical protein